MTRLMTLGLGLLITSGIIGWNRPASIPAATTALAGAPPLADTALEQPQPPQRATTLVNFDGLDASNGGVEGPALVAYLARFGIEPGPITKGTKMQLVDTRKVYGGKTVVAASPFNVLTQAGSNDPVKFTLLFDPPLFKLQFTRPQLLPSSSGVTHPPWKATAFDVRGIVLDSEAEKLIASYAPVPTAKFTLWGPGISGVLIESDNGHFAGFSAVLLHEFQLTR
jgi:hypothetical protein